jgi:formylmethanofuran dehydrogenase subunit E
MPDVLNNMEVRRCDECGGYYMAHKNSPEAKCSVCRQYVMWLMLLNIWNKVRVL